MILMPREEQYAGGYRKLAMAMLAQNAHDAMHLLVPMHAEAHVRTLMPYVGYQRSNPCPELTPWAREITDARHWLMNDAYDLWLGQEGGLTLSWCAEHLGRSADDLRGMFMLHMRLLNDAETMWLPDDLAKVKAAVDKLKSEMNNYKDVKKSNGR